MTDRDEYETRVYLKKQTAELLLKAVEIQKEIEHELNRDPCESDWRLANMKIDRERIINQALREWLPSKEKKEVVGEDDLF